MNQGTTVVMKKQWRRFLPGNEYLMAPAMAQSLINKGFAELPGAASAPPAKAKQPGPERTQVTGPKETGEKRSNTKKKTTKSKSKSTKAKSKK